MSKWIISCMAVLFIAGTAMAQTTLLDESKAGTPQGTTVMPQALRDLINADCDTSSFVVQAGSGTYTGIYGQTTGGVSGWVTMSDVGDQQIQIWCDIEMYLQTHTENNKIYFHRATADAGEQVAYVQGWFTSNNGQYIGIESPVGNCDVTELKGTKDILGRDVTTVTGYAPILVDYTLADQGAGFVPGTHSGTYRVRDTYGEGDQGSVTALWWLINSGGRGTQYYEWKITINPPSSQPDGHYELDPVVTAKPAL